MGLCLDADSKVTWHSDFEALVYDLEVWSKVSSKLDSGKIPSLSFLSQITCADNSVKDDFALFLRQKAREIFFARYSHVIGYHGCRPRDPESYRKYGILPSSTERLISEARSLFQGFQGFDEALCKIGTSYRNHNEGKVGLLLSAVRAKNDPSNSHMQGSELIRALAYRLGNTAQLLFATTGKPTLIKCRIPIEWLDSLTTFPVSNAYINQVLVELINKRICPNDHYIGFSGAYMLTRSVPPECILEFIDMTNCSDDEP